MTKVHGKVVAVTGGARGIGLATATALRAAGAVVAIGDVDEAAVKAVGQGFLAVPLDVTDRASFTAFLDRVEAELGPIDVLVNNAGVMPIGALLGEDDATARRCVDVNLHGMILGTKVALARMAVRGRGHVINVASIAGMVPAAGQATYAASKHGVVGFTEAVRLEFKDSGVDVSAVLPSFTNTELIAGTRGPKGMTNSEPEQIAAAILGLVARPRPQVIVPARLALSARLQNLTPRRAREAVARLMGLDRVFLDIDAAARKGYDDRIQQER